MKLSNGFVLSTDQLALLAWLRQTLETLKNTDILVFSGYVELCRGAIEYRPTEREKAILPTGLIRSDGHPPVWINQVVQFGGVSGDIVTGFTFAEWLK